MKTLKKGFTLIELLVVIAIIGILASVVLASLNSARSEGEDARDIANLNNARSQAELYYSTTGDGSYEITDGSASVCDGGVNSIDDLVASAIANGGECNDDADEWAAWSPVGDGTNSYCVDSTGFGGEVTTADLTTGDVACP